MAALYTDGSSSAILSSLPTLSVPPASPALRDARVVIVGGSIGGLAAAACLLSAGFTNIKVLERNVSVQPGAGIGLDDASAAVLKGLGVPLAAVSSTCVTPEEGKCPLPHVSVQRMRWVEQRTVGEDGRVLHRQPAPFTAVLYAELVHSLERVVPEQMVKRGCRTVRAELMPGGTTRVHFEQDGSQLPSCIECDLLVGADGPRSIFRALVSASTAHDDLRFAGYVAWRGTVQESTLPSDVITSIRRDFPLFSNCLYFLLNPREGQSAVLYDIGNGMVNWLVYQTCDSPRAQPGRTTATATPAEVDALRQQARCVWGDTFGRLVECTPDPFQNDIYDIALPMETFASGTICVLGDAAHPVTPHAVKGSNLTIQDAFVLASVAQHANSLQEMLAEYSRVRVEECNRTLLLSRYLGRVLNNMPGVMENSASVAAAHGPTPHNGSSFEQLVLAAGLSPVALPIGESRPFFRDIWRFMEESLPADQRGFALRDDAQMQDWKREPAMSSPKPISATALNHISRETRDVPRMVCFYQDVLGLSLIKRPNFGFGGAWFGLPGRGGSVALHIIESDPEKPSGANSHQETQCLRPPERFIRRSEHFALTVTDIEEAKQRLAEHGVPFAINSVPGTDVVQLFVYDPDENGIEIGNFDVHANNSEGILERADFKQDAGHSIYASALNHISRETRDVPRMVCFYQDVLGLSLIKRPNFGFGGAWFGLPGRGGSVALHIIESDPEKPSGANSHQETQCLRPPERFIRRSEHFALTVTDIEEAKQRLAEHGVPFAINSVPGTDVVQLFVYDPDENGIEIGNFNVHTNDSEGILERADFKQDAAQQPCMELRSGIHSPDIGAELSSELVLYSSWFCPYAQRVWIALEEKGVAFQYVEIDPYEAPSAVDSTRKYTKNPLSLDEKRRRYPDWVAASPQGLVPALRHKCTTVCDSMVCLEYIEEVWQGVGEEAANSTLCRPHLLPKSPKDRAHVRYWCVYANEKIIPFYYRMLMEQGKSAQENAKQKILTGLFEFATAMAAEGPFFLGACISMADIMLFPWYERLVTVGAAYRGFSVPHSCREFARLKEMYAAMRTRPAVGRTLADQKRLIENYAGYADNSATSNAASQFRSSKG